MKLTLTLQEQEEMIRRITLYVVPVIFAIVLIIGLIGNTLVIGVVSRRKYRIRQRWKKLLTIL